MRPATVAWWDEAPGAGLSSWLLVGPGPPPLAEQAWVHQLAVPAAEADGWAVACQVALGPLPAALTARLRDPAGAPGDARSALFSPDGQPQDGEAAADLRPACLAAALALIAERLRRSAAIATPAKSAIATPAESGIRLLRLRAGGVLDIAPAAAEPGGRGGALALDLDRLRWRREEVAPLAVTIGDATVQLPVASLALVPPVADVEIPVALPVLWRTGVPEPVVRFTLQARGERA